MDRRLTARPRAVTLLELLIAMILFSVIALGFYSIDTFSRRQVITADRQAQVQNEVSIAIDHVVKHAAKGIGAAAVVPSQPAAQTVIVSGEPWLMIYEDLANDKVSPGDGKYGTEGDCWVIYRYRPESAGSAAYQIWFYPRYGDSGLSGTYEIVAIKITQFDAQRLENRIDLTITGCWDPTGGAGACGSAQNPQVTMSASANIPGFSLN